MIAITIVEMIDETLHTEGIITAEEADPEVGIGIEEVLKMIEGSEVMAVLGSKKEHQAALIVNKKVILLKIVKNQDKNFKEI